MSLVRVALTVGLSVAVAHVAVADDDLVFLEPPQVVTTEPGPEHQIDSRTFQGIPSLAMGPKGRLWAVWYASPTGGEDQNNYVVVVTSGDDGQTWSDPVLAIDPDRKGPVRAFDPQVWLDPDGRLWVFWARRSAPMPRWAACGPSRPRTRRTPTRNGPNRDVSPTAS